MIANVPVALPPILLVDAQANPVPGVALTIEPVTYGDLGVFMHEPSGLYYLTNNVATTNSSGYATFAGITFAAPANSTMPLQIYTNQACRSEVLYLTVTSAVASLQVVQPGQPMLSCPAPGSLSAYLADCGCANAPSVLDLGDVPMGTLIPVQLFASDALGRPMAGVATVEPFLNEIPPYISLQQYFSGIPVFSTNATNTVLSYGTATRLPPFLSITFPNTGTNASGISTVYLSVGVGYPGQYAVVFGIGAGASTRVISFTATTLVAGLTVVVQPGTGPFGALTGNYLEQQPVVMVTDVNGNALQGYQVNTYASWAPVSLALNLSVCVCIWQHHWAGGHTAGPRDDGCGEQGPYVMPR